MNIDQMTFSRPLSSFQIAVLKEISRTGNQHNGSPDYVVSLSEEEAEEYRDAMKLLSKAHLIIEGGRAVVVSQIVFGEDNVLKVWFSAEFKTQLTK